MRSILFALLTTLLLPGCTRQDSQELTGRSVPPWLAEPAGYEFEPPVQLMADGEPIAVEAPGFACPTMADVDLDGRRDLVVGQFASGKMHFFKNIAPTGTAPEFAKGEWIMTGDEPATVPGVS